MNRNIHKQREKKKANIQIERGREWRSMYKCGRAQNRILSAMSLERKQRQKQNSAQFGYAGMCMCVAI